MLCVKFVSVRKQKQAKRVRKNCDRKPAGEWTGGWAPGMPQTGGGMETVRTRTPRAPLAPVVGALGWSRLSEVTECRDPL